ncbi:MAG: alpha/beta hydrolase family protein [Acutalibacteraceae bacterium]
MAQKCVSYKFTYDSDGYYVKAYISIPVECIENEKPYKCIIYNRGGNSKIGLLNDEDTANICTATNRIVVASQYRGTDGGTGIDQFGGEDLNDIIALIDMCENDFDFVDMSDLCVAGVSRGGMMAYMTARQDNRVKRIIAVSAVSDLVESYNSRDDMKKVLNNYIGGSPEDLPYDYEKRSAICWADEIDVPVLMIHSKYDKQVSFVQAEALNDKFKENGTECTFIKCDDDVHGLHSEDEKVIFEWLNKY